MSPMADWAQPGGSSSIFDYICARSWAIASRAGLTIGVNLIRNDRRHQILPEWESEYFTKLTNCEATRETGR